MPISFYGRRRGYTLEPMNIAGENELARIGEGVTVKITIKQERTLRPNNLFHSISAAVAAAMQDMGRDDVDRDWVTDQFKVVTGHSRLLHTPYRLRAEYGPRMLSPRSIDFASMDELEFRTFLDRVTAFTAADLLPHIPVGEYRQRIEDLLDPEARRLWRLQQQGRAA